MKKWTSQGGALLFALLASSCCILPLVLAFLGVGSLGFSAFLLPYRGILMGTTVAVLAAAFYFTYRKPKACDDGSCGVPRLKVRRWSKITLWLVTVLVIAMYLYESGH